MKNDILSLNPSVPVILTSKHDWDSMKTWIDFIKKELRKMQRNKWVEKTQRI